MDEGLLSIDWAQVLGGLDLSDSWDILVDKIIQLRELYVTENKVSGQSDRENPFINQACIEAIRAKNTKWQKYKHCKSNINYDHYKAARNRVTAELRNAKYNFEQNLAAKIKTDNKLFWSYVRSKQKTKTVLQQLQTENGEFSNDSAEKANLLNNYFASVFEVEGSKPIPEFPDRPFLEPLLTITLTQAVILRAKDKIKSSKSQGPDGIHPKLVKECKSTLVKPLELIYRKSLESGKLPSLWKQGNVTAIFKSGDKTKPENYRPISLTSVPAKLLERIIRDQLVEHMMVNNLFAKSQHGFISGKSCVT